MERNHNDPRLLPNVCAVYGLHSDVSSDTLFCVLQLIHLITHTTADKH